MSMDAEKERNRIRDNQRRSRARKKEYVQELEKRLRDCQLQGIEASSEVQQAARRVRDENQKLRQLLNSLGLGDNQVDQYLKTGQVDSSDRHGLPTHGTGSRMYAHAATTLDSLLIPRRPVFKESTKSFVSPSRQTSTDPTLSYETESNSPVESYGASSESVPQSQYDLESATSMNISPQPVYRQSGGMEGQRFAAEAHSQQDLRWLPANQAQPPSSMAMNLHGYGANQTLDFHASFPGADSTTNSMPPTCRGPIPPQYAAYETMHQQPTFVSSQLGRGSVSHSGTASVSDTDSSAEDRRQQQAGNPDDYPWMSADPRIRSQFNPRHG